MPHRHLCGQVKIILPLPSREVSYWYVSVINTVATSCHILKLKCTKFDFGSGSAPDPAGEACSAAPDPLAGFNGPTSKERKGRKDGRERQGRREKREEKGRGRDWEGNGGEKGGRTPYRHFSLHFDPIGICSRGRRAESFMSRLLLQQI